MEMKQTQRSLDKNVIFLFFLRFPNFSLTQNDFDQLVVYRLYQCLFLSFHARHISLSLSLKHVNKNI